MKEINLVSLLDRYNTDDRCREALEAIRWPSGVACLAVRRHERFRDHDPQRVGVRIMRLSVQRDRRDDHAPLAPAAPEVVSRHLPDVREQEGHEREPAQAVARGPIQDGLAPLPPHPQAMGNDPFDGPTLVGVIEIDETMIGGKKKRDNWRENKTWVAGAVERGGKVRIERIPNIKKGTIQDFVRRSISDDAEAIYTDELRSHVGLETDTRKHESVNHGKEEWVVGDVHTTVWKACGACSSAPSSAASTR